MTEVDKEENDSGWSRNLLAENVARTVEAQIRVILNECTINAPAKIEQVSFQDRHLQLSIRWPFRLPTQTGNSGDWFPTRQAVNSFRKGFKEYLLEQHAGARISNVLHADFVRFLLRFLRVYRFTDSVKLQDMRKKGVKRESLEEKIIAHLGGFGERRLAGKPRVRLSKAHKAQVTREVRQVHNTLIEIQEKIRGWKKRSKRIKESTIEARLRQEYDRERYPWISIFFRTKNVLPPSEFYLNSADGSLSNEDDDLPPPTLCKPDNWSATDLAVLVAPQTTYRRTGNRYPLHQIKNLLTSDISET